MASLVPQMSFIYAILNFLTSYFLENKYMILRQMRVVHKKFNATNENGRRN